jgi:hypothetical protein
MTQSLPRGLTPQQAQDVSAHPVPTLGYLTRLTDRMQRRGWKADVLAA